MKATIEHRRLNTALRRMSTAVGTVAPLVLQAEPDVVEMLAVGRESIMFSEVEASVEARGAAELTVKQMGSVVKSLPNGRVVLEDDQEGIALSGGDARVVLAQGDDLYGAELPEPPEAVHKIEGESLRSALNGVIPSAATDNHPLFGSVRFDESDGALRLVASDTYRLAVRDLPGVPAQGSFSVGVRSIKRMLRALGKPAAYGLSADDGYAWFAVEGLATLGIVCDRSDYPRYQGWAPPWQGKMVFARGPLLDLTRRVVALDKKSPAPVKLVFSESRIELVAKSSVGMVTGTVDVERAELAEKVTLRFNSGFVADALANLISDQVEIRLAEDPLDRPKPVLIADVRRPEAWNLVMPMRAG